MLLFLDTDVVSNLRKVKANDGLLSWLANIPEQDICISVPTLFEIQFGIEKLRRDNKVEIANSVEAWLEALLKSRLRNNIISVGLEASRLQAKMFADPALRHFHDQDPRSPKLKFGSDLILSALAIVHDAAIVTFDGDYLKHVHRRYPLPGVFHPGRGVWLVRPLGLGADGTKN